MKKGEDGGDEEGDARETCECIGNEGGKEKREEKDKTFKIDFKRFIIIGTKLYY